MTKSRNLTQYESDAKHGRKIKGFKLKLEDIAYIEQVATKHGLSHNELLLQAIRYFDENKPVT